VSAATVGVLSAMDDEMRYSGHSRSHHSTDYSGYTGYETFATPDFYAATSSWQRIHSPESSTGYASTGSRSSRGSHSHGDRSRRPHSHSERARKHGVDKISSSKQASVAGSKASTVGPSPESSLELSEMAVQSCTSCEVVPEEEAAVVASAGRSQPAARPSSRKANRNLLHKMTSLLHSGPAAALAAVSGSRAKK